MRHNEDGSRIMCSGAEDCQSSYPSHKWGALRAHGEGWFISKAESKSFCPNHVPRWVPVWRAWKAGQITGKEYRQRRSEVGS